LVLFVVTPTLGGILASRW